MTSIPLTMTTIKSYVGNGRFNGCQDISSIHLEYNIEDNSAIVEAQIPASSTRQGSYKTIVKIRPNGTNILGSTCSCPVGGRCKHIYAVLRRISESPHNPIHGPDQHHLARVAKRRRLAIQMEHASVYVALTCCSEVDSGRDYQQSMMLKDNFDQQILGVFFSRVEANRCAKAHVQDELGYEVGNDDDDDDDDDGDDDDDESFEWNGFDFGYFNEEDANACDKVWVERRAIQDASPQFRK